MMRQYKWYFLKSTQKIAFTEFVGCESDEDAKCKAAMLLAETNKYHAIEIWDGRRRVHLHVNMVSQDSSA